MFSQYISENVFFNDNINLPVETVHSFILFLQARSHRRQSKMCAIPVSIAIMSAIPTNKAIVNIQVHG